MAEEPEKGLTGVYLRRRSGFSIFDFWKRPGWRLGTGAETKGVRWYGAVGISVLFGLWMVWADIVGGASFVRIATIWMVVAGVSFYFLIRIDRTLFWVAIFSATTAALTLVLQIRLWFVEDKWPGWTVRDFPAYDDLLSAAPVIFANIEHQSAIGTLIGLAVLATILAFVVIFLERKFS